MDEMGHKKPFDWASVFPLWRWKVWAQVERLALIVVPVSTFDKFSLGSVLYVKRLEAYK